MNKIKTIFFGNNIPQFEVLLNKTELKAVFTRESNNDEKIRYIKEQCQDKNIAVYTPKNIKPDKDSIALEQIKNINPDLIVSGGYHLVVPQEIIDIPKYSTINIHPALLPKYRGQHVIQWQIINDEKITGTTIHYMTKDLDKGDIILQKSCELNDNDTALDVWEKTSEIGKELLEKTIDTITQTGKIAAYKQDESKATYFNARKPEDGRIKFNQTSKQIYNLTRALVNPWPGAYFIHNNKKYLMDKIIINNHVKGTAGNIKNITNDTIEVYTSNGSVILNKNNFRDETIDINEFKIGEVIDDVIKTYLENSKHIEIRQFSNTLIDDYSKQILNFENEVFKGVYDTWNLDNYKYQLLNKNRLSYLIFVDNNFAGTLIASQYKNTAHINRIGFYSEFQGLGLGKNIVALFESEAKKLGLTKVTLSRLNDQGLNSASFFKNLGYNALINKDAILTFLKDKNKESEIDKFYPLDKKEVLLILEKIL